MDILNQRWVGPRPATEAKGLYATDGLCHNAEPGTYGHECSKPATWLGLRPNGSWIGYCDACKVDGTEARQSREWAPHPKAEAGR